MAKILVIEDDAMVAVSLKDWIEDSGHRVEIEYHGQKGLEILEFSGYDLAIVDWQLPGLSGPEIVRRYRKGGGKAPILMLTQKSDIQDKIQGLEAGADDYLPKPFDGGELLARVKALLRRSTSLFEEKLNHGGLEIDCATCTVKVKDRVVRLLPKEFELLEFFLRHPGTYFTAELLIKHVWNSSTEVGNEAIRTVVSRIRSKFDQEGQPSIIETAKGFGYRISDEFLRFVEN